MVGGNITSLSGNGLRDWFLQRLTAVCVAVYVLVLLVFLMTHTPLTFLHWHGFMHSVPMRIFNILFVLCLSIHAWIGAWTVTTDYLKCACLRIAVQTFFIVLLLISFIWGIATFWGI